MFHLLVVGFINLLLVRHPFVLHVMPPLVEGFYIADTFVQVYELDCER